MDLIGVASLLVKGVDIALGRLDRQADQLDDQLRADLYSLHDLLGEWMEIARLTNRAVRFQQSPEELERSASLPVIEHETFLEWLEAPGRASAASFGQLLSVHAPDIYDQLVTAAKTRVMLVRDALQAVEFGDRATIDQDELGKSIQSLIDAREALRVFIADRFPIGKDSVG